MRVNIYSEELTTAVELIRGPSHVGLRLYLDSPDSLFEDDSASAVTIWAEDEVTLKELIHRFHDVLPDA